MNTSQANKLGDLIGDIQNEAKLESELASENPILPKNKIQIVKDRYVEGLPYIKIGDGITKYNDLPFITLREGVF